MFISICFKVTIPPIIGDQSTAAMCELPVRFSDRTFSDIAAGYATESGTEVLQDRTGF
jgi:hypothetical protein